MCVRGPGSSVGLAPDYGLHGSGISAVQTVTGTQPSSCTMGTGSFPGGKVRPGRASDHSPLSSVAAMEE